MNSLKNLFVDICEHHVKFTLSDQNHQSSNEYTFTDKKDYKYKEQLDTFFEQAGLKGVDFDECIVSWFSPRTTLIPANVFAESKPDALFGLCFGDKVNSGNIDYNRIPDLQLVNIYEIPLWVKSYFVLRYPKCIIQHEGSHNIRGHFNEASFTFKSLLTIRSNHALCLVSNQHKLHYYSVFEYKEAADLLYNFMFMMQQKEFIHQKGSLHINLGAGAHQTLADELQSGINRIQELNNLSVATTTNFITNSQTLCV